MRLIFIGLIFLLSTSTQQPPQTLFKISNFTQVPAEMEGCGENFFLNKQDEKAERFVFYTDYVKGLIKVNNKMILLNGSNNVQQNKPRVFSNKEYVLEIKYGQKKHTGDESYEYKSAIITLKHHSKVIWSASVVGGGGC